MRKIAGLATILLTILTLLTAMRPSAALVQPPFCGAWRGVAVEETAILIEFSPEGYYRLQVGENQLTESIDSWGKVKYGWGQREDRYLITIFGEKEPEMTTRLEAVITDEGLLRLFVLSDSGTSVSSILLRRV